MFGIVGSGVGLLLSKPKNGLYLGYTTKQTIMKILNQSLAIIFFLFLSQMSSYSQSQSSFKKDTSSMKDKYYLEDVVMVTDGKGENVNVKFRCIVPVGEWDSNVRKSGMSDKEFFN